MLRSHSGITTRVDFSADGLCFDYLHLPHSTHESAYGRLIMPIVSARNGDGPTVLLMAGNHGDEYEGQIALSKLARALDVRQMSGRVIILPMANFPAAKAGKRTSPLDGGNLNRSFPGNPRGTPTERIAHFIEHDLMPMADYVVDLHSGGSTIAYMPSVVVVGGPETDGFQARLALARAFGCPDCLIFGTDRAVTHLGSGAPGAALRMKRPFIAAELGYGGTLQHECLELCERGIRNVLMHAGIFRGQPETSRRMRTLRSDSEECFVYALEDGLFEPAFSLGDAVDPGSIAGWMHHPESPSREPGEYHFERAGIVINRLFPAAARRGDMLYRLAVEEPL